MKPNTQTPFQGPYISQGGLTGNVKLHSLRVWDTFFNTVYLICRCQAKRCPFCLKLRMWAVISKCLNFLHYPYNYKLVISVPHPLWHMYQLLKAVLYTVRTCWINNQCRSIPINAGSNFQHWSKILLGIEKPCHILSVHFMHKSLIQIRKNKDICIQSNSIRKS